MMLIETIWYRNWQHKLKLTVDKLEKQLEKLRMVLFSSVDGACTKFLREPANLCEYLQEFLHVLVKLKALPGGPEYWLVNGAWRLYVEQVFFYISIYRIQVFNILVFDSIRGSFCFKPLPACSSFPLLQAQHVPFLSNSCCQRVPFWTCQLSPWHVSSLKAWKLDGSAFSPQFWSCTSRTRCYRQARRA